LGPPGTAICVYHNNVVTNPTQYNQGLYSVFLEDIMRPPSSIPPIIPNQYFAVGFKSILCRVGIRHAPKDKSHVFNA